MSTYWGSRSSKVSAGAGELSARGVGGVELRITLLAIAGGLATLVLGLSACSGVSVSSELPETRSSAVPAGQTDGKSDGAAGPVDSPSVSMSPSDPPGQSSGGVAAGMEAELKLRLEGIGATEVGVVEHGFRDAQMQGRWNDTMVVVRYRQPGVPKLPGSTSGKVDINGQRVMIVNTQAFGYTYSLGCRGYGYEVAYLRVLSGPASSSLRDLKEFVRLFVESLDC